MIKGEAVFIYQYDVGSEIDIGGVKKVYAGSADVRIMEEEKMIPAYISLSPSPVMVSMKPVEAELFGKRVSIRREVKVFNFGVLSVMLRVPLDCPATSLVRYALPFAVVAGGRRIKMSDVASKLVEEMLEKIRRHVHGYEIERPLPEEYTVFCLSRVESPEKFFDRNQKLVAAVLKEENRPEKLGREETKDALRHYLSYSPDDFVVVSWNNAILLEPSGNYDDVLLVIELANMQLLELRVYEAIMDRRISRVEGDMKNIFKGRAVFSGKLDRIVFDISQLRIEMTSMIDEMMNIAKFFGDWYLAKLYMMLSDTLYIKKWHEAVLQKLEFVEDLYVMASDRQHRNTDVLIEVLIVLLIMFEIALTLLRY